MYNDIYNDITVIEAVNNLKSLYDDLAIMIESGDYTEDDIRAIYEADNQVQDAKKLSVMKRISVALKKGKSAQEIASKYEEKALSSGVTSFKVKLYQMDKSAYNDYYNACKKCKTQLNSLLKFANAKDLSKDEIKEIKSKVKDAISERNSIITSSEKRIYNKVETTVSASDVKKAISNLKKDNSSLAKLETAINNISMSKNDKTLAGYINSCINGCEYMIIFTKSMEISNRIDNYKTIVVSAAQYKPKKEKVQESFSFDFDDADTSYDDVFDIDFTEDF